MTTGLRVPSILGLDAAEQRKAQDDFNTMDGVEKLLAGYGLEPLPQPTFSCPEVTEEELTTTDNTQYTKTYARLLAWFNYMAPLLATVTGTLLQIENSMTYTEAAIRKKTRELNTGKTSRSPGWISAEEINDAIILDPDYHELQVEHQRLKQIKTRLSAHVENVERGMRVVSRQVEIRKIEIEGSSTESNMPGRNKFPPLRQPGRRE